MLCRTSFFEGAGPCSRVSLRILIILQLPAAVAWLEYSPVVNGRPQSAGCSAKRLLECFYHRRPGWMKPPVSCTDPFDGFQRIETSPHFYDSRLCRLGHRTPERSNNAPQKVRRLWIGSAEGAAVNFWTAAGLYPWKQTAKNESLFNCSRVQENSAL